MPETRTWRRTVAVLVAVGWLALLAGCGAAPVPNGQQAPLAYRGQWGAETAEGMLEDPPPTTQPISRPGPAAMKLYNEALAHAGQLEYAQAIRQFLLLLEQFRRDGHDHYAARTLFWLGFCYEKQSNATQAQAAYRRILRDYPQSDVASRARDKLVQMQRPTKWKY